jgi:hypothetical protein
VVGAEEWKEGARIPIAKDEARKKLDDAIENALEEHESRYSNQLINWDDPEPGTEL